MKAPTPDTKLLRDLASASAPERWAEFLAAYREPMLEYLRGAFLPCYSRSHRHPPIPGAWQTDGSRETRTVPPCETIELESR